MRSNLESHAVFRAINLFVPLFSRWFPSEVDLLSREMLFLSFFFPLPLIPFSTEEKIERNSRNISKIHPWFHRHFPFFNSKEILIRGRMMRKKKAIRFPDPEQSLIIKKMRLIKMRERISLRGRGSIERTFYSPTVRPSFAVIFEYFWKLIYPLCYGEREKDGA